MAHDIPVLIVGGGPVGLTLALELDHYGVDSLVLERRSSVGKLPKMERCNSRTMENYRRIGLSEAIHDAGLDNDAPMDVFVCARDIVHQPLVHHRYPSVNEFWRQIRAHDDGTMPAEPYQLISQYTLEPLLSSKIDASAHATIRRGVKLLSFTQDVDGVTATVRAEDGTESTVRTRFLVGCDGGASTVRAALGIELRGESLAEFRQALFRCPGLYERIPIGKGRHYHVADAESSFLIVQDDKEHFSLHAQVETDEDMSRLFRRIIGMDLDFETLYVGEWRQRLMLADRYRDGRVFLAGDAAHLVIPTGGLGMNTGAGDAVDLAWKLWGDLSGWGGPGLLDSYETERRQIGDRNVRASRKAATGRRTWRSMRNDWFDEDTERGVEARARLAEVADHEQRWSNDLLGIELGYRYRGSPLIHEEEAEGPDPENFDYEPTTWPGARLPQVRTAANRAIQDLVPKTFALVCTDEVDAGDGFGEAYRQLGVPFDVVRVREPAVRDHLDHPLLLVRPDLHIVWRGSAVPADVAAIAAISVGLEPARVGESAVGDRGQ